MHLGDALENWLQIRLLSEALPTDEAAHETVDFFVQILREDHDAHPLYYAHDTADAYVITYERAHAIHTHRVDETKAQQLVQDMQEGTRLGACRWDT